MVALSLLLWSGIGGALAQPAMQAAPMAVAAFDEVLLDAKKQMMGDPSAALHHARAAEDIARASAPSEEQTRQIAQAYWLQAEALNRLNRPGEAAPLVQRALGLIGEEAATTKLGGDLVLAQGRIARVLRDDQLALSSFHQAHDIFAALGATRYQAISLQSLGSIYQDARDYERVIDFYQRASAIHEGDPALDLASFNNRANALRELGRYSEALKLTASALALADNLDSPILRARILSNIASIDITAGDFVEALKKAEEALVLLEANGGKEWRPVVLGIKAQALTASGEHAAAAAIFDRIFEDLERDTATAPFRDIHDAAYKVYKRLGRSNDALVHLETFKTIDDSARELAADANNVLKAAEFDFATQELAIAQLQAARLKDEIALRKAGLAQRTTLLGSVIVLVLLVVAGLGWVLIGVRRSRRKIAEARDRLAESNTALDKANQAKTAFLAATSHEIRTPLNGILGMAQVMAESEDLSAAVLEQVEAISGAGNTLLAVVNDILDVATLESGDFHVAESPTDIVRVAGQVVGLFQEQADAKGIGLHLDTAGCPGLIISDEMRLRQVLFNLISNGIKFTSAGDVRVVIAPRQSVDGESLSIAVADSGIGIPDEQRESIFAAFHQVDGKRTRKFGGAGLGLAICRHITTALRGTISVQSQVGEGSRFEVLLPLQRAATPSQQRRAPAADAKTALDQLDVLVVEDNLLNRTVIKALLEKKVASMTLAEDGVQGIAALSEGTFDIVLMDKQMPNMDGLTAITTIRASDGPLAETYIVAITADAYDGAREELLTAGADDYLAKPVNLDTLVEALERSIDRGLTHRPHDDAAAA